MLKVQQLSVKYLLKCRIVIKIFVYVSDPVFTPSDGNGLTLMLLVANFGTTK